MNYAVKVLTTPLPQKEGDKLKKYLFEKRNELYEKINDIKDRIIEGEATDIDRRDLEILEGQLNIVLYIMSICSARNRY